MTSIFGNAVVAAGVSLHRRGGRPAKISCMRVIMKNTCGHMHFAFIIAEEIPRNREHNLYPRVDFKAEQLEILSATVLKL